MKELLTNSVFFGVMVSILTYELGMFLKRKLKLAIFNPLLISIAAVIVCLLAFNIDYDSYNAGAKYISYLLTPATVCLAVPLYEQVELLKKNAKAIFAGILSGVLTSILCVLAGCAIFGLSHEEYVTLLPKSITTAIGMGVSEELGGIVTITVAVIIITGVFGNMMAEFVCKVFRIQEPVAKGIAIGSAAHAVGTAKAMEMGDIEGAMSSLSIAVAGLMTVVAAPLFAGKGEGAMIITVGRECGSGGHAIGEALAAHYGIRCYDRHILVSEAKARGMYDELENFFSEKPMDSLLYSIAINNMEKRNATVLKQFHELITENSFVLIGRCGNYIYKNDEDVTTLFIHSDMDSKIERTMHKQNMDRIKAKELIEYVDSKREAFHKRYTDETWGDARNYQLTVNSSVLGVEQTAEQIIAFIDKKHR